MDRNRCERRRLHARDRLCRRVTEVVVQSRLLDGLAVKNAMKKKNILVVVQILGC